MGPLAVLPHHWRILKKCTATPPAFEILGCEIKLYPCMLIFVRGSLSTLNVISESPIRENGKFNSENMCSKLS